MLQIWLTTQIPAAHSLFFAKRWHLFAKRCLAGSPFVPSHSRPATRAEGSRWKREHRYSSTRPAPPPSGPASLGKAPRGADTRRVSEPAARRRTPTYHPRGSLCSASPDQPSGWHPECHGDHGIRSIFSRNETRGAGAWLSLTQDVAEFPLVRVNILGNQFIPGYPFLLRRIEMKVVHGRKLTCGKQRSVLPQS